MNKIIKVLMMLLLAGILYCLLDSGYSQPPVGAWQGYSGITLADVYNAGFFHRDSSDTVKGKPVFDDTVKFENIIHLKKDVNIDTDMYFWCDENSYWRPVGATGMKIPKIQINYLVAGAGESVMKFIKIGTHCAIIMNANADTLWLAADTSGF